MIKGQYLMAQISKEQGAREGSFGFLIQTLAREIDVRMKQELKGIGVDIKLFANLMALLEEDGINQRQLGKKQGFPEYFTSRNVDALVKAGFVERKPDPSSRRTFLIYLTAEGRQTATRLPPLITKVNDEALSNLTTDEQEQVVMLLKKTANVAE
jgi:DNA-binding MarR family transcriptional regulator